MLVSQKIQTKWNSKTKKHYEDLGYVFTKIGDPLIVNVHDLTDWSNEHVICKCDYCGREFSIVWGSYFHLKQKENNRDCCGNPECTGKKAQESLLMKYGVNNCAYIKSIKEKTKQTNLERYGCENPFGNAEIKAKIKQTNLKKYGVESAMQVKSVQDKAKETCLNKYGYTSYGAFYSTTHIKELSPVWKGGVAYHRVERSNFDYRQWRKSVFARDNYTCQCCDNKSYSDNPVTLEAHHILNWRDNIDGRYDVDNGITLCKSCHKRFHSIYGKRNNTKMQLDEFLNITEKVC